MMKDTILAIFKELNERITVENVEREETGASMIRPVEFRRIQENNGDLQYFIGD